MNTDLIAGELKKIIGKNLISIVLFGSYARGESDNSSDVDLLLIVEKGVRESDIERKLKNLCPQIDLLVLTKKEFKSRVLNFNHQLITLFYDGKVLYDSQKFYYKMENLFLALNRKKEFEVKVGRKRINLDSLRRLKGFI